MTSEEITNAAGVVIIILTALLVLTEIVQNLRQERLKDQEQQDESE